MAIKTFNINEDLMEEFRRLHKGDMSAIVSDLISNYLNIKKENLKLEEVKNKIEEATKEVENAKKKLSNLKLLALELEKSFEKELEKEAEVRKDVEDWAKDCIQDAKQNKQFTQLQLDAEKKGYTDVKEYLINEWLENERNER